MYASKSKTPDSSNDQSKTIKLTSKLSSSQPYLPISDDNNHNDKIRSHQFLQPPSIYDHHYKQQHRIIKNYSKKLNLTTSDLLDSKEINDTLKDNNTTVIAAATTNHNQYNYFSQKFKSSAGSFSMSSPATTLSSSSISASPCSFFMQNLTFNAKILLADVIWSQESEPLEFRTLFKSPSTSPSSSTHSFSFSRYHHYQQNHSQTPCIVKAIKNENDEYLPAVTYLFLYSKIKLSNVLCQPLDVLVSTAAATTTISNHQTDYYSQISIPAEYPAWFEVLSEDGKSVRPLQSIKEILNHFSVCLNIMNTKNKLKSAQRSSNSTTTGNYLVRENLNAFCLVVTSAKTKSLASSSSFTSLNVYNFTDLKKTLVKLGDKLTYSVSDNIYVEITNELSVKLRKKMIKFTLERVSSIAQSFSSSSSTTTFETIYIPEDAKGKFSPIARRDNISGVHQLKDLISKFKLPITVQLVHPHSLSVAALNAWNFSGKKTGNTNLSRPLTAFRLLKIHQVENMLGYSISGQITQLSSPPSQHQTQQQYATQQQSHNHHSKLIKLPSYIKLDFVRAVNMQEMLASRTSSSYYLRFILNECEKYHRETNELEASIQKSYLNLIGIKDLSELLNASNDNDTYKEIDDLYQYVRTGVLPHYLKNETLFHNGVVKDNQKLITPQPSSSSAAKTLFENEKLALKLLKNYSNESFMQMAKSVSKKKPYVVDDSLASSYHNISSHTKQKKQLNNVTENFLYEYASLSQSRALPAPPPRYKVIAPPPTANPDTVAHLTGSTSLNNALDKIILAAKNLNNSYVDLKSKSKSSNRLYFMDKFDESAAALEEGDFTSVDYLKLNNESKLDLNVSLPIAPLYSATIQARSGGGGVFELGQIDLDDMNNNNLNDSISYSTLKGKPQQQQKNVYSVTRKFKDLPKYDYFNTILNSKHKTPNGNSNKKYVFNSIQDLNKYF